MSAKHAVDFNEKSLLTNQLSEDQLIKITIFKIVFTPLFLIARHHRDSYFSLLKNNNKFFLLAIFIVFNSQKYSTWRCIKGIDCTST